MALSQVGGMQRNKPGDLLVAERFVVGAVTAASLERLVRR